MTRSVAHDAPEPARALIAAMLAVACDLAELPAWFERHNLQMTSPTARQVLWALGRRLTQNPDVGFTFADRVPLEAVGSLWRVYEAAPSLRALNGAYNEWSSLLLDYMDVRIVDDGSLTWFRMVARDGTVSDRAEQDYRAGTMIKLYRRLLGNSKFAPRVVHFAYAPPSSTRIHSAALGTECQLRFAQPHLQIALLRVDADAPLPGADRERFERLSAEARSLAKLPCERSLAARVETMITERLVRGMNESSVARGLGISVRSLRRRLAEGGVTFRILLERARRREAELLLEHREGVPMARVARLLGFASDRSLRNSMRRWNEASA
jgi:AraC-like DNA-binding protein